MKTNNLIAWGKSLMVSFAVLGCVLGAAVALPGGAFAQSNPPGGITNTLQGKMATLGSTYTNATTGYTDLVSVTYTPVRDPAQTDASLPNGPRAVQAKVEWSADVSKATATTGTCAVYANGAVIARTARTIGVMAGTLSGEELITLTTKGANVVKVQCKSGDTNTFTVNNATLLVGDVE